MQDIIESDWQGYTTEDLETPVVSAKLFDLLRSVYQKWYSEGHNFMAKLLVQDIIAARDSKLAGAWIDLTIGTIQQFVIKAEEEHRLLLERLRLKVVPLNGTLDALSMRKLKLLHQHDGWEIIRKALPFLDLDAFSTVDQSYAEHFYQKLQAIAKFEVDVESVDKSAMLGLVLQNADRFMDSDTASTPYKILIGLKALLSLEEQNMGLMLDRLERRINEPLFKKWDVIIEILDLLSFVEENWVIACISQANKLLYAKGTLSIHCPINTTEFDAQKFWQSRNRVEKKLISATESEKLQIGAAMDALLKRGDLSETFRAIKEFFAFIRLEEPKTLALQAIGVLKSDLEKTGNIQSMDLFLAVAQDL